MSHVLHESQQNTSNASYTQINDRIRIAWREATSGTPSWLSRVVMSNEKRLSVSMAICRSHPWSGSYQGVHVYEYRSD